MCHTSMFRAVVVLIMTAAIAGCASRTPAPIDNRRPGAAVPPAVPPVALKPPAPLAPPPPAEPEIEVQPIGAPGAIEVRPLGASSTPPTTAPAPASAAAPLTIQTVPPAGAPLPPTAVPGTKPAATGRIELRTEPRAFKVPFSEENLAMVLRGEDPRSMPAKPMAKPPAAEVKPPIAAVKPEVVPPASPTDPDSVDWAWPAPGRVIETFESNTKGLAIGGRMGEPVMAAAGGRVVYSGSGLPGYGQLVIIKHNDVYLSAYAHNSRILVKEGEAVKRGQKIAELGATDADRPKLHFEIRRAGKPIDPLPFLPERR